MRHGGWVCAVALYLCAVAYSSLLAQQRTVWDGVYSPQQARRGAQAYAAYCQTCHLSDLTGGFDANSERVPALKREGFGVSRGTLDNLFDFISEFMPADAPGTLTESTYADIISYLLEQNGMPAGASDLASGRETLRTVLITSKPR